MALPITTTPDGVPSANPPGGSNQSQMPKRKSVAVPAHHQPAVERAIAVVLAAGLLITAVLTSTGSDHFRLPKELAFRAEAVLLLGLGVWWVTATRRTWTLRWDREHLLALAIAGWAAVTTLTSTNRMLSADSLVTILAAITIFVATCLVAQTTSLIAIDVLMIGCCLNAAIVILQESKIWSPLGEAPGAATHFGSAGLLGNPNDVGTYLVGPAVAAFVLAVVSTAGRRRIYAVLAVLLVAGIVASATRTAIAALVAGFVVFAIQQPRRIALLVLLLLAGLGFAIASSKTTLGLEMRQLASAARHRDFEQLSSERLVPFLAAIDMTRDHPLVGVGPGCFKYHFMRYRVGLFGRYPERWTAAYAMNWSEVHNDHLQVAAETGLPGYALFLAAIAVCAGGREREAAVTRRSAFARTIRWPLAATIITISLGQFPLELAAPRLILLTLAALSIVWSRDHVVA